MIKYSTYCFILFCTFCFSQNKNEQEVRIPLTDFPKKAQNYFNSIAMDLNYLKFYKETDNQKCSFEAKFKINKLHYSLEFDTIGRLEDIEVLIKKKHIPKAPKLLIFKYLDKHFKNVRILKIQKQYVNNTEKSDKQFIEKIVENPNDQYTHFEIIAEIKTYKKHELQELTFNKTGVFEKSRVVTSASYEHALY